MIKKTCYFCEKLKECSNRYKDANTEFCIKVTTAEILSNCFTPNSEWKEIESICLDIYNMKNELEDLKNYISDEPNRSRGG